MQHIDFVPGREAASPKQAKYTADAPHSCRFETSGSNGAHARAPEQVEPWCHKRLAEFAKRHAVAVVDRSVDDADPRVAGPYGGGEGTAGCRRKDIDARWQNVSGERRPAKDA